MTGSDCATDRTDTDRPDTDRPERRRVTVAGTATHPHPEVIFDPDLFEELRGTIGVARMQMALQDLAATLPGAFADQNAAGSDPQATFHAAHRLTGRAGVMGFTALQDACVQVQQACEAHGSLGAPLARARRISLLSQRVIVALLKRCRAAVIP